MLTPLVLASAMALGQPTSPCAPWESPPAAPQPETTPMPPLTFTVQVPTSSPPLPPLAPPSKVALPSPERTLLMQELQGTWLGEALDDNRLAVSGWGSMTYSASTDRSSNLPMGMDYLANQFPLQQGWVRFERFIDPNATTPTWGFRMDTLVGTDYRFTLAHGLFDSQLTDDHGKPNLYGVDMVQFYGELYVPDVARGLDLKVGRFYAPYGVESIDTTQNALVSNAYNFLYNPFTDTGLLATLKLDDAWTVQAGLVTGSDVFIAPQATPTFVGSVKWAPPTGADSLTFSIVLDDGRYSATHATYNPELFDLVYTHKFSDRLLYTMDATYSFETGYPNVGFVNNWGVVHYLTYQIDPKLSGTVRVESFDDVQGEKTGYKGLYSEVTGCLTYKPLPFLWLRPELRFDNNADSRPFDGNPNLFTASFNVVVRW